MSDVVLFTVGFIVGVTAAAVMLAVVAIIACRRYDTQSSSELE